MGFKLMGGEGWGLEDIGEYTSIHSNSQVSLRRLECLFYAQKRIFLLILKQNTPKIPASAQQEVKGIALVGSEPQAIGALRPARQGSPFR